MPIAAGSYALDLQRPVDVESVAVTADTPAVLSGIGLVAPSGTADLGAVNLPAGRTEVHASARRVSAVALKVAPGSGRGGALVLDGLEVRGSSVGGRVTSPRIVVTYPRLHQAGGRLVGERFGDQAYLEGWAESPAGPGRVKVAGVDATLPGGAFGTPLQRPADATGSWAVTLVATFPGGATATRTIYLDDDESGSLDSGTGAAGTSSSDDAKYGKENQSSWGKVTPDKGGTVTLGTEVRFDAPAGAVSKNVLIGITHKGPEVVPPLDAGMVNVTAPHAAGYRFLPSGQQFKKQVHVTLPYDPALLPEGVPPSDVLTYFYDEKAERWVPLPRDHVNAARHRVVSLTTHFTFMINAVLVLPGHPTPAFLNPTSIKSLKAADPSAGIDLIQPPGFNSQGAARGGLPDPAAAWAWGVPAVAGADVRLLVGRRVAGGRVAASSVQDHHRHALWGA